MRSVLLLLAMLPALPLTALAGTSSGTLKVGVTVVAACPPGSGKPCSRPVAPASARAAEASADERTDMPITVLRDEAARTLTVIY